MPVGFDLMTAFFSFSTAFDESKTMPNRTAVNPHLQQQIAVPLGIVAHAA